MKFLLDECIVKKSGLGDDFISSVDVLGRGASDKEVFKLANDTKTILVTNDRQFILNALTENKPVWYQEKGILIKPVIQRDLKYQDVLTFYCQKTKQIVIP